MTTGIGTPSVRTTAQTIAGSRWLQLVLGIICLVMIANLQYGWTLFILPIDKAHGWGRASIQAAFSIEAAPWVAGKEGRPR